MQWFLRKIWLPLYGRWSLRYVQKKRRFRYQNISLEIPPGVFHPGLFFSSTLFIDFLKPVNWLGQSVLDVGTGSGLLAIFTAKNGAHTTAIDINPLAVATCRTNAAANQCAVSVLQSDLFRAIIPGTRFDYVLVNPPYFAADAKDDAARAFFAGANLDYFYQFFSQLHGVIHHQSKVWMILGDGCDFTRIYQIAAQNGFKHHVLLEKTRWGRLLVIVGFDADDTKSPLAAAQ
jgi:release factor glutamine methyltransferase